VPGRRRDSEGRRFETPASFTLKEVDLECLVDFEKLLLKEDASKRRENIFDFYSDH